MIAKNYKFMSALIFVICMSVSVFIFNTVKNLQHLEQSKYLDTVGNINLNSLHSNFETIKDLLSDLKAFYGSSNHVDRAEFSDFLSLLYDETTVVDFVGWLPKVNADNYKKLVEEAQKEGVTTFAYDETRANTEFYPLLYAHAYIGNRNNLIGMVFSDIPELAKMFNEFKAMDDNVFLFKNDQVQGAGTSFWAFRPIYQKGEFKPENFLGFAVTLFSIETLLENMKLIEKSFQSGFVQINQKDADVTTPIFAPQQHAKQLENIFKIPEFVEQWGNHTWVVQWMPSADFLDNASFAHHWLILLVGFLISSLYAYYYFMAGLRNKEVFVSNQRLEAEIQEHKLAKDRAELLSEDLRLMAQDYALFAEALKGTINGVIITDATVPGNPIVYVNKSFKEMTQFTMADISGKSMHILEGPDTDPKIMQDIENCMKNQQDLRGEFLGYKKNGETFWCEFTLYPVFDEYRSVKNYVSVHEDVTLRKKLELERIELEQKFSQQSKLESLGSLAAGIAHEINTPVQYVRDNVAFLSKTSSSTLTLLEEIEKYVDANKTTADLKKLIDQNDLSFLKQEVPESIRAAEDGILRVKEIVMAVKDFSRPTNTVKSDEDMNKAVEGALLITRNQWKDKVKVTKNLAPNLPPVCCNLGEINQVLLNLIVNAIDATENNPKTTPPEICISTSAEGKNVVVTIADNGPGIPPDLKKKIFDPFFTTKVPGKGTGQGLAISRMIIVKNHEGALDLDESVARGACFKISLPPVAMGELHVA